MSRPRFVLLAVIVAFSATAEASSGALTMYVRPLQFQPNTTVSALLVVSNETGAAIDTTISDTWRFTLGAELVPSAAAAPFTIGSIATTGGISPGDFAVIQANRSVMIICLVTVSGEIPNAPSAFRSRSLQARLKPRASPASALLAQR